MHYNYPIFQTESFLGTSMSFKALKSKFMEFLSDPNLPELSEEEQDKILNLLISPDIENVCLGMDMLEEKRLRKSIKAWIIVDETFEKYYEYWIKKIKGIND